MQALWMYGSRPKAMSVTTPPAGNLSGLPLLTQPILTALGANGLLDPAFVGTVTAAVTSGPGSVTAGSTAIAIAGIVTFVGLIITGAGTHVLTFTAPGRVSAQASVTVS